MFQVSIVVGLFFKVFSESVLRGEAARGAGRGGAGGPALNKQSPLRYGAFHLLIRANLGRRRLILRDGRPMFIYSFRKFMAAAFRQS